MGGFALNSLYFPKYKFHTGEKATGTCLENGLFLPYKEKKIKIPSTASGCAPASLLRARRTDLSPLSVGSRLIHSPPHISISRKKTLPRHETRHKLSEKLLQRYTVRFLRSYSYLAKFVHPECQANFSPLHLKRLLSSGTEFVPNTNITLTISSKLWMLFLRDVQTVKQLQYFLLLFLFF